MPTPASADRDCPVVVVLFDGREGNPSWRRRVGGGRGVKPVLRSVRDRRQLPAVLDRARRGRLLLRLRVDSLWRRAGVEVSLARDLHIGRDVRIILEPGTHSALQLGTGCLLGDGVRIRLSGGRLLVGDHSELRRNVSLQVGGALRLEGQNVLQAGCSLHCDDHITLGRRAVLSEYTTVVDSAHHYTTPEAWFLDNVRTGPVAIGPDAWVGAKATIGRGVTIGDHAIVSANSLVTSDVPPGHLASGVPAEVRRPVDLPWNQGG